MGGRLQMSADIYDWLAELRDSDPSAAKLVIKVLALLADSDELPGAPLVTAVDRRVQPGELPSAMNWRYQTWLESLASLRRELAQAKLTGSAAAERRLTEACQSEQLRADTFRARQEILRSALAAAQDDALTDPAGAAARLEEITSWIEPDLNLPPPADGLLDLRPGAPADSGLRILFAVEPPGTILLIAVLEGANAIRDHYREAVLLASEVLAEVRAGHAPEAAARTFDDAQSFQQELHRNRLSTIRYNGSMASVAETAGSLLRRARVGAGLSQAELAVRAGVAQSVISAYEAGRRQPALPTLARLIDATGYDLVVDIQWHPPELSRLCGPVGQLVRHKRRELVAAAAAHDVRNLRVFGSVARGEDHAGSDVDLIVDLPPGMGLLGLGRVQADLEAILGTRVDLVPASDLKPAVRERAERDLVAL